MAIQVNGTTVIDNSRNLNNIASIDATTAAAIGNAGVGAGTSVATSTSASPTFNASSDNVFIHSSGLTSSSSVTFSNLPTEKEWSYYFNSGANTNQISSANFKADGISYPQGTINHDLNPSSVLSYREVGDSSSLATILKNGTDGSSWSHVSYGWNAIIDPTGTKILVNFSNAGNYSNITRFNLSTAFDINTISYVNKGSLTYQTYQGPYNGFGHIDQSGRGFFIAGNGAWNAVSGRHLHWQQMSTAWDPTTLQTAQTYDVGFSIYNGWMANNGTYVYYVDGSGNVYRRTLSTPYNLSTVGSQTNFGYVSGMGYSAVFHSFSPDGKYFTFTDSNNLEFIYECGTAWNLTPSQLTLVDSYRQDGMSAARLSGHNAGVRIVKSSNNDHLLIMDFRGSYTPSFSQIPSNPLVATSVGVNSWAKVDFMTADGGTNIYAAPTYKLKKG